MKIIVKNDSNKTGHGRGEVNTGGSGLGYGTGYGSGVAAGHGNDEGTGRIEVWGPTHMVNMKELTDYETL